MKSYVALIALVSVFGVELPIGCLSRCPDNTWHAFIDEKCYKLLDSSVSLDAAQAACLALEASLPEIQTSAEQDYLANLIFEELGTVDNIWLGAKRDNETGTFSWVESNVPFGYTNWAEGSPVSDISSECVQMISKYSKDLTHEGQWKNTICSRRNLVVCQTENVMTMAELQKALVKNRQKIYDLEQNPVPRGFIHVQLPDQPTPDKLWPQVKWIDVTSKYAGLFFRAAGGDAAPFGQQQAAGAPRLAKVRFDTGGGGLDANNTVVSETNVPLSGWSGFVSSQEATGHTATNQDDEYMRFFVEGSEVRPINTAVRMWKRD